MVCIPDVLEIEDIRLPVVLERKKRKTLAIQITQQEQLLIKAPLQMPEREIYAFLQKRRFWIYKQFRRVQKENETRIVYSEEEIKKLKEEARSVLTDKTYAYAKSLGVTYNRIRIGSQKTCWGSCSSKGTISYNWHLILMPEEVQDYVVVHELCHLLEMNHSKFFWQKVASVMPEYATYREWLKRYGNRYGM